MIRWLPKNPLLLASQSEARRNLLSLLGIQALCVKSDIDERDIEGRSHDLKPEELALTLAKAKALSVNSQHSQSWVMGCDQVLEHDHTIVHKAKNRDQVIERIRSFSGSSHVLHSACALAYANVVQMAVCSTARVGFRTLSESQIKQYVDANISTGILSSVGSYHFENEGIGLISEVDGERSTIIGLPVFRLIKEMFSLNLIALSSSTMPENGQFPNA